MQHDTDDDISTSQDFATFAIATVRVPNQAQWHLEGFMASQAYLFPGEALDDTYRQLQGADVIELAARIESEEGLPQGALGRATLYGF